MFWHHISLYGIWWELEVYGLVPLQDTVAVTSLFKLACYYSSI